jgi:hypothetical protein
MCGMRTSVRLPCAKAQPSERSQICRARRRRDNPTLSDDVVEVATYAWDENFSSTALRESAISERNQICRARRRRDNPTRSDDSM